jgi:hypothetical protein
MSTESPKLKRLREIRQNLAAGKFQNKELKTMNVSDTDGRNVRLTEPDALEVLDRRIAAEEAEAANG